MFVLCYFFNIDMYIFDKNNRIYFTVHLFIMARQRGARNFFPINAPGMGRFKLFNLVGYS